MTAERNGDFPVRRVIVALDSICRNAETLTTAVGLAARLNAEVAALFIEDDNLFRLVALPAARHVSLPTAPSIALEAAHLEADMRERAAAAETLLAAEADRLRVPWSFRVLRGLPAAALHGATATGDLLVVGREPDLAGLPWRVRSSVRKAVEAQPLSALVVPQRGRGSRPLVVVAPGSPLMRRSIAAARRFQGSRNVELDALMVGGGDAELSAARDLLGRENVHVHAVGEMTATRLVETARRFSNDLLVVAGDVPLVAEDDGTDALLAGRAGLLLLVR